MPVCKGCGGSYDDSFKFCPYCGRAKPKREAIKVKVEVTSEDVWEICEIHLVYISANAERGIPKALGVKVRRYVFEATAIGPDGKYAAGRSELLEYDPLSIWGLKTGDYHYDDETKDIILHRDNTQVKVDKLIKELTAKGWQPTARGEYWYSERFRRLVKKKKTSSKS